VNKKEAKKTFLIWTVLVERPVSRSMMVMSACAHDGFFRAGLPSFLHTQTLKPPFCAP
jgi:hypothetical protein